jgi:hypothetical protein
MLDPYYLWKKNRDGQIPVAGGELPLAARMAISSRGQLPLSFKIKEEEDRGLPPSASRGARMPTFYVDSVSVGSFSRGLEHFDDYPRRRGWNAHSFVYESRRSPNL